jgi:hypothetical protein
MTRAARGDRRIAAGTTSQDEDPLARSLCKYSGQERQEITAETQMHRDFAERLLSIRFA